MIRWIWSRLFCLFSSIMLFVHIIFSRHLLLFWLYLKTKICLMLLLPTYWVKNVVSNRISFDWHFVFFDFLSTIIVGFHLCHQYFIVFLLQNILIVLLCFLTLTSENKRVSLKRISIGVLQKFVHITKNEGRWRQPSH
jgi:hypothetical protein